MAENNLIVYKVQVDTASGKIAIDGLTKGFVQASTAVTKLTAETKKLSAATAQAGTTSGIAGAFVNEFGRTISDLPYGIQGVSNNISQLGSLFAVMVVSAGSAKKAMDDLMATLRTSPILAWLLVFQVVTAAITYFDKQTKKAKESVDAFNKSLSGAQGTIAKLEAYASVLNDVNASSNEQLIALSKLKKEGYDPLIGSVDKFIEAKKRLLIFNVQEEALTNELKKLYAERIDLEQKYAEEIKIWAEQGNQAVSSERSGTVISTSEQIIERRAKIAQSYGKSFQDIFRREEELMEKMALNSKTLSNQLAGNPFFDQLLFGDKSRKGKLEQLKLETLGTTGEILEAVKKDYERILGKGIFDTKPLIKGMIDGAKESLKGLKAIDTSVRDNEAELEVYRYNKGQAAREATLAAMADFGNNLVSFLDDDFQRQLDIEQNKTTALNNELRQRLLNESLSADERKKIQGEIAKNDEDLRKKQEKIERKRFEMQKAANISRAVIDTYVAANAALKNGGGVPAGLPPMIATIAAGLLQVASISKQQFVSSQSGVPLSVGTLSDGGTAAQAPEFNIVGQGSVNQLAAAVQSQFDRPMKTYVVAKEVASANELERNVIKTATIG